MTHRSAKMKPWDQLKLGVKVVSHHLARLLMPVAKAA